MQDNQLQLVSVNARADNESYAHMFKYDSVFGRYPGEVSYSQDGLIIDGKEVTFTRWPKPKDSAWRELGCDIVVEATGKFKDRESCQQHLDNGARKVIISAPGKDADVTICPNVNDQDYDAHKHQVISSASCTTNCLAPVAKVLQDSFGIKHGFMTTIHSYTMTQRILDGSHKDLRRARAAGISQIPTTTGAAKAVTQILPSLEGKLDGIAVRVPTADGSLVDLVCELEKKVSAQEVNAAFKAASNETLGYSEEPLVSVDYIGDSHGGVVDALSTMMIGQSMVKVLAWYDNEAGFTHQLARLIRMVGSKL
jgi:glyceraldehyde 3-phosphate dehydrogenase